MSLSTLHSVSLAANVRVRFILYSSIASCDLSYSLILGRGKKKINVPSFDVDSLSPSIYLSIYLSISPSPFPLSLSLRSNLTYSLHPQHHIVAHLVRYLRIILPVAQTAARFVFPSRIFSNNSNNALSWPVLLLWEAVVHKLRSRPRSPTVHLIPPLIFHSLAQALSLNSPRLPPSIPLRQVMGAHRF